jgi:hypothetical protein
VAHDWNRDAADKRYSLDRSPTEEVGDTFRSGAFLVRRTGRQLEHIPKGEGALRAGDRQCDVTLYDQ